MWSEQIVCRREAAERRLHLPDSKVVWQRGLLHPLVSFTDYRIQGKFEAGLAAMWRNFEIPVKGLCTLSLTAKCRNYLKKESCGRVYWAWAPYCCLIWLILSC